MASILDLDPVDWCGKQVESFKEAFYEATFNSPELSEVFTIITGIKAKAQIVVLGFIDAVGKTKQMATCAPDESNRKIPSAQKSWDPEYIEDRFVECWKDLLAKFTAWGLKNNIKKPDLSGTDFAIFLEESISMQIKEAIWRIAFFGDKDAELVADGGNVSNMLNGLALDVRYVNAINGLWKQWFAIAAANPAQYQRIEANYRGVATPVLPVLTAGAAGTLAAATYYVRVSAINAVGETIASPEANVVIPGGGNGSISVAYTPVAGATGYRVYVGTASGAQAVYFVDAASPLVITTLVGGVAGSPKEVSSAATYAGQKFTQAETEAQTVTNILESMNTGADTRLSGYRTDGSGQANVKYWVTKSIADQYKRERRSQFPNIDLAYTRTETGWLKLEVDGIELFVLDFEDRILTQFFNNGVSIDRPHRIYYADKSDVLLGVEEESTLMETEAFYDQVSKRYFIDLGFNLDAKFIEDYKIMLAY